MTGPEFSHGAGVSWSTSWSGDPLALLDVLSDDEVYALTSAVRRQYRVRCKDTRRLAAYIAAPLPDLDRPDYPEHYTRAARDARALYVLLGRLGCDLTELPDPPEERPATTERQHP